MIASDLLRAGIVLCFLFIRSPQQLWLLYVLTVMQFTLSALFTPARTAVLANVVPRSSLVTANALDALTWSSMLALGAFLGGVVAAIFGVETAFVMDAATFTLSAWMVSRIQGVPSGNRAESASQGLLSGLSDFREGFRYLRGVPFILGISLVKAAGSLAWGAVNVLEISYANDIFPLGSPQLTNLLRIESGGTATLGIFYVVSGLGTGLGPLLTRRVLGDAYQRLLLGISGGFLMMSGGILWLSAAATLPWFVVATLVRTVGSGVIWVFSAAMLQMLVPDRYRGRVFAFEFAALTLTQSVSTFSAGYLQDTLGLMVRQVTAIMGATGVAMIFLWGIFLLTAWPHVRQLPKQSVSS